MLTCMHGMRVQVLLPPQILPKVGKGKEELGDGELSPGDTAEREDVGDWAEW